MSWETVTKFEEEIAKFFGAPYAVAVDSCTHGIELCLRLVKAKYISCPRNTYLSIPMLANKLNIPLFWQAENYEWLNYYRVHKNIYDAAVLWKANAYIDKSMMCVSMQYQKHLSIGRLGIILLDNKEKWLKLKKMSYDGRLPGVPWREQNIDTLGFHYYAQPELCSIALNKLPKAIKTKPRQWIYTDWPDLTNMIIFKNKYQKIYNQIINRALSEKRNKRKTLYFESHHIIPKCLGGADDNTNRVLLTAREHFIVHKLLCLMFPKEYKFKLALWRMATSKSSNQSRDYQISAREFQKIKEEMSKVNSSIQIKRWENVIFREQQSIRVSRGQIESYKKDPDRAKRLSESQIKSYLSSDRALKLSDTQRQRYKDSQERIKTGLSVKKSKTPEMIRKMSKRFSGKNGTQWRGYVYIFHPNGHLIYKFESVKQAHESLRGVIIKNNRVGKKGKWKGYKFIITKKTLKKRLPKNLNQKRI